MNNTGSFGAATGGISPELQQAMSSRQGTPGTSATQQVTNTAPTADPTTQVPPMQEPPAPQAQPMPSTGSPSGLPFDPSGANIILKSMDGWLKTLAKSAGVNK